MAHYYNSIQSQTINQLFNLHGVSLTALQEDVTPIARYHCKSKNQYNGRICHKEGDEQTQKRALTQYNLFNIITLILRYGAMTHIINQQN